MKKKVFVALLAGTMLLAACKGSINSSTSDTLAKKAQDSVKLVKTAEMQIKVRDVRETAEIISKITTDCGGMVMHYNLQANIVNKQDIRLSNDSVKKLTIYNTTAAMVVKIPSEIIEPFMDSLNRLGIFIDGRKMYIEDRTLDYISEKLKAENRQASVKLRSKIKLTQKCADSILILKDDVVDRKVNNMRTKDAAKYSVLNLSLYQNNTVSKEVIASDDLSDYNTSLWVRLGLALSRGRYYFSEI